MMSKTLYAKMKVSFIKNNRPKGRLIQKEKRESSAFKLNRIKAYYVKRNVKNISKFTNALNKASDESINKLFNYVQLDLKRRDLKQDDFECHPDHFRLNKRDYIFNDRTIIDDLVSQNEFSSILRYFDGEIAPNILNCESLSNIDNIYGFIYSETKITLCEEDAEWVRTEFTDYDKDIYIRRTCEKQSHDMQRPICDEAAAAYKTKKDIYFIYLYSRGQLLLYEWYRLKCPYLLEERYEQLFNDKVTLPRSLLKIIDGKIHRLPIEALKLIKGKYNWDSLPSHLNVSATELILNQKNALISFLCSCSFEMFATVLRTLQESSKGEQNELSLCLKFSLIQRDFSIYSSYYTEFIKEKLKLFPRFYQSKLLDQIKISFVNKMYYKNLSRSWLWSPKMLMISSNLEDNPNAFERRFRPFMIEGKNSLILYDPKRKGYATYYKERLYKVGEKILFRLSSDPVCIEFIQKRIEEVSKILDKLDDEILLPTNLKFGMSYYELKYYLRDESQKFKAWAKFFCTKCSRGKETYLRNIRSSYLVEPYLIKEIKPNLIYNRITFEDDLTVEYIKNIYSFKYDSLEQPVEILIEYDQIRTLADFARLCYKGRGFFYNSSEENGFWYEYKVKKINNLNGQVEERQLDDIEFDWKKEFKKCKALFIKKLADEIKRSSFIVKKEFQVPSNMYPIEEYGNLEHDLSESDKSLLKRIKNLIQKIFHERWNQFMKIREDLFDWLIASLKKQHYENWERLPVLEYHSVYDIIKNFLGRNIHQSEESFHHSLQRNATINTSSIEERILGYNPEIRNRYISTFNRRDIKSPSLSFVDKTYICNIYCDQVNHNCLCPGTLNVVYNVARKSWREEIITFDNLSYGYLVQGVGLSLSGEEISFLNKMISENIQKDIKEFKLVDFYIREMFRHEYLIYLLTKNIVSYERQTYYRNAGSVRNRYFSYKENISKHIEM